MKTTAEMRMHCLTIANTLAVSKNIPPKDVIPTAMEYMKWIDGGGELADEGDVATLRQFYKR